MSVQLLKAFFVAIEEDNCIGTSHISLFTMLFHLWCQNNFQNPVFINRHAVMRGAKISGLATYHRCLKCLAERHYIEYFPSYHPGRRSRVVMIDIGLPDADCRSTGHTGTC